ncbi:MAG TPA: hypothetical protein PKI62_06445 [bacterium]|nr:hypothetical protein [bacterium]HPR89641.1 hypothetical protein [bacterium]
MTPTDISERGRERLVCAALTGSPCVPGTIKANAVHGRPPMAQAGSATRHAPWW